MVKKTEMDDETEIPNVVLEGSIEESADMEETHTIESSPLDQFSNSESDNAVDLTREEKDYVTLFDHKKKELEVIQNDLNELMVRLNNFITDSQDDLSDLEEEDLNCENPVMEQDELTEKQDGPQEKELLKQNNWDTLSVEDIYTCDGLSPPEVNWDVLAPFIQNVVGDLQKIRNLNQMTNSVLQRMRNLTGPEDCSGE